MKEFSMFPEAEDPVAQKPIKPEDQKKKKREGGITRREFLNILGGGIAALSLDVKNSSAQEKMPSRYEKGWFYTLEEMKKIYEKEYSGEKILKNIVEKRGKEFVGSIDGEEFIIPERFIDRILTHLGEMLEQNTARYLFRLDAFHGHLFIPEEKFKSEYLELSSINEARVMVDDSTLGILYHNSEHLKSDSSDREVTELRHKRNVLGWISDRPLDILPFPGDKMPAANTPNGAKDISPYLRFAANKDGVFSISVNDSEVRLDISFDDSTYY